MIQLLQITVLQVLKKYLNTELPYDPVITPLNMYTKELKTGALKYIRQKRN